MEEELEFEWIENYHKGRLSGAEQQAFRQKQAVDTEFASKVKSYEEIMDGISYYGKQQDFAETLRGWEQEIKAQEASVRTLIPDAIPPAESTQDTKVISLKRSYLYWAAAAVALLIVGSVLLLQPQAPNTLALYETYYKPYPNVFDPSVRGDEHNEVATIRQKAFLAYQAGHYAAAADYFKRLEPAESKLEQDNIRLYLGNCYLAMDSLDAAIRTLAQIDAGSHVASQATWYLAMAYLKAGTPDRAREVLQILAAEDGSYADRAHAILKQLD